MAQQRFQQRSKERFTTVKKQVVHEKAIPRNRWQDFQRPASKTPCFASPTYTELKGLIAFLLLSILTLLLLDDYPAPTAELRSTLGIAPPLLSINLACVCYFFSEVILIICRERTSNTDRFALNQLFFISAFYIFYWYAGALQEQFVILLLFGSVLQLFESCVRSCRSRKAEA